MIHLVILMPLALSAQVQQSVTVIVDMQEMDIHVKVSNRIISVSRKLTSYFVLTIKKISPHTFIHDCWLAMIMFLTRCHSLAGTLFIDQIIITLQISMNVKT